MSDINFPSHRSRPSEIGPAEPIETHAETRKRHNTEPNIELPRDEIDSSLHAVKSADLELRGHGRSSRKKMREQMREQEQLSQFIDEYEGEVTASTIRNFAEKLKNKTSHPSPKDSS